MENWNLTLPHESSCAALKPPQKLAERLKVNYHVREAMSNIIIILLKDPESAFKSLPFQGLPKFLYPQDRFYNPPVLHYGYAFSWEWLWDYAANRNLLRNYAKTRSNMKACLPMLVLQYVLLSLLLRTNTLYAWYAYIHLYILSR